MKGDFFFIRRKVLFLFFLFLSVLSVLPVNFLIRPFFFLPVFGEEKGGGRPSPQGTKQDCRLKGPESFLALSGPMNYLFFELGLLNQSPIKAISFYHGFSSQDLLQDQEQLGGGLFLSVRYLKKFAGSIAFYDSNQEQKKIFQHLNFKKVIEIDTRGLDPFEVVEKLISLASPYLEHCEDRISFLRLKLEEKRKWILQAPSLPRPVLFYLGQLKKGERDPNLLMLNDGPVLFWLKHKKIQSYPSPLAYVPWSQKIVKDLERQGVLKIGLVGERKKEEQKVYESFWEQDLQAKTVNIYNSSFLIPGIPQIYFMEEFFLKITQLEGSQVGPPQGKIKKN